MKHIKIVFVYAGEFRDVSVHIKSFASGDSMCCKLLTATISRKYLWLRLKSEISQGYLDLNVRNGFHLNWIVVVTFFNSAAIISSHEFSLLKKADIVKQSPQHSRLNLQSFHRRVTNLQQIIEYLNWMWKPVLIPVLNRRVSMFCVGLCCQSTIHI